MSRPAQPHRAAHDILFTAGWILALTTLVAVVTRLGFAAAARGVLRVQFITIAHRPGEAIAIFAHNARLMLSLALLTAVAYAARNARTANGSRPVLERGIGWTCDIVLIAAVAATACLAGVLLGAYGLRQVKAFLPHGPVELAAWAVAISLYVRARTGRISLRRASGTFLVAFGLLALAATLEIFEGTL